MDTNGFIKLIRSQETEQMLAQPNAFTLLSIIAFRAKRTNSFSIHNLKTGQALIGDYCNYGMTLQQYRTAKSKLTKWGFATFQSTNKGTIATLIDKRIYDINEEPEGLPLGHTKASQKANEGRQTKNERMKEKKNTPAPPLSSFVRQERGEDAGACSNPLFELFEQARRIYPGDKRGAQTEFENLKRKHKDWTQIIPALEPAIQFQIMTREKMQKQGEFVPPWKHFKTYINNRCWESKSG